MERLGKQTIKFNTPPSILEVGSIVGPKESEGPFAKYFDQCIEDEFWGEKTWEKAESKFIKETVNTVINKSSLSSTEIDYCFAGDLLNQCISSSFGLRELNIPFFGIFYPPLNARGDNCFSSLREVLLHIFPPARLH